VWLTFDVYMPPPDLRHISRLLERKFGRDEGRRMLLEALQQQRLSGYDLRDIVVSMSDGRLVREAAVRQKIQKKIEKAVRHSKAKGYVVKDGVRIYQGGSPGLIQQKHA